MIWPSLITDSLKYGRDNQTVAAINKVDLKSVDSRLKFGALTIIYAVITVLG
jgi:hypothetical protein